MFAQLLASVSINTMRTIGPELDLYLGMKLLSPILAEHNTTGSRQTCWISRPDPDVAVWFASARWGFGQSGHAYIFSSSIQRKIRAKR